MVKVVSGKPLTMHRNKTVHALTMLWLKGLWSTMQTEGYVFQGRLESWAWEMAIQVRGQPVPHDHWRDGKAGVAIVIVRSWSRQVKSMRIAEEGRVLYGQLQGRRSVRYCVVPCHCGASCRPGSEPCTWLFGTRVGRYTPNAVVELLPHRHCVGATLIAP